MKKFTCLFCLLIVSILSYAVNEAEIKAIIEANSDVEVNVSNESTNPWEIENADTLYNSASGGVLTITYESDGVIQMNTPHKEKTSFYVDGTTQTNGAFIAPGEHELEIRSTAANARFSGFSLQKICSNADIKSMIEANSDIILLELVNDKNKPWGISGIDSLYNPVSGGTITFVFETDHITELTYTSKVSSSIYVDGTSRNSGVYIPAGKHEISIKSTSSKAQVIGLSIKKLCTNEDIKNMIQAVSDVEIVEVINDSVKPWAIIGQDSLYNPTANGTLTIVFESDRGVFWKNSYKYINHISIDTVNINNESSFIGNYIPAGRHTFNIKSKAESKYYGLAFQKVKQENEDIKSLLQATCEVEVLEVVDASDTPWTIVGKDSLRSSQNSYLLINYYSDQVVALQATKTSSNTYIYLNGVSQNNTDYLPAGNHIIALYTNTSTPQYVTLSLDKYVTTEAEIEDWIEANSDLDIIEVINDPINPWILRPDGALENTVKGSQLIVTYETDNVIQLNFGSSQYVSFTLHGATKQLKSYFPDGTHTLIINSTAQSSFLKELSFAYICSNSDIEEWIEANSDVDVTEFVNDSINPWYVSDGYLCNPNNPTLSTTLSFSFETDYITSLNWVASNSNTNYGVAFSVDGITKNKNSYIPSGNHTLYVKSSKYLNLQFSSISITNICTNEDIKKWLEKESDIEIIEIQNDSVNPWIIKEQDTLYNPTSGTLSFTFHSEGTTQLEFTSANNYTYIYVDGKPKGSGTYIPAGAHEIKISGSSEKKITTFSIKEISSDVDIKAMIEAYSDIEVDILNDSVAPWIALGEDTLSHPFSTTGFMKLAFETEYITQLDYLSVSGTSIYLDSIHQLKKGNYLPAGKHELTIKGSSNAVIKGLSIKNVCTDADIKAMIETYSDIEVDILNDSVAPWIALGEDTLSHPFSTTGIMKLAFETEYITQLDYLSVSGTSIYLDSIHQLKKGNYLPAGKHELTIKCYSNAVIKGLSLKNVCTDEDIEHAIEANSDVDVTIINDTINPWVVLGGDTLYNQKSKPLTITYESDSITQVSCDNLHSIYINGLTRDIGYYGPQNIPAGKNEIIIKSPNQLTGLSIKKICSDADIKQMIEDNSDVEVEIINDSINPWIIQGQDTLSYARSDYHTSLRITYETEYITQITFNQNRSYYIDDHVVKSSPECYIPAGKHTLLLGEGSNILGEGSNAIGLSIKKICTDEDIKAMLEANIDARILEVQNDSVWAWALTQPDELNSGVHRSTLSIVLETEHITQLQFSDTLSDLINEIYINGEEKRSDVLHSFRDVDVYLSVGKHTIKIVAYQKIAGLSIKKSGIDYSIEEAIEELSDVNIEVTNDSIWPWFMMDSTTLVTVKRGSKLSIQYSSDKLTQVYFGVSNVDTFYIDGIGYPNGYKTSNAPTASTKYVEYSYLFSGNHTIGFGNKIGNDQSTLQIISAPHSTPYKIHNFNIKQVKPFELINIDRNEGLSLARESYYDVDNDGHIECFPTKLDWVTATTKSIPGGNVNLNNDEWWDNIFTEKKGLSVRLVGLGISSADYENQLIYPLTLNGNQDLMELDYNNDGYPDLINLPSDKAFTVFDSKMTKSNINALTIDEFNQKPPRKRSGHVISLKDALTFKIAANDDRGKIKHSYAHNQCFDITGDGIPDYILPDYTKKVSSTSTIIMDEIIINDGDGNMIYQDITGDYVDIDGDGIIDVIGYDGRNLTISNIQKDGTIKQEKREIVAAYDKLWGYDFDKDGDKDILLAFNYKVNRQGSYLMMLENINNEGFQSHEQFYSHAFMSVPECVDFDNDGYYEVIWGGSDNGRSPTTHTFSSIDIDGTHISDTITILCHSSCGGWGYFSSDGIRTVGSSNDKFLILDENNDGILEVVEFIDDNTKYGVFMLADTPNARPNKPNAPQLSYETTTGELSIMWEMGKDKETSSVDLTYELRIGSEPGKGDILYAHASPNGMRKNLLEGNQSTNRFRKINTNTWAPGKYYISVQVVDPNYRGSEFSDEVVFEKKQHATSFTLEYETPFSVGDTCLVHIHPNVLKDSTHYLEATNGLIVNKSNDELTYAIIFNQDGEQFVTLYSQSSGKKQKQYINVLPVKEYKTNDTYSPSLAMDLNEDGYIEFFGGKYGAYAWFSYNEQGEPSRINKLYNDHTYVSTARSPLAIDKNRDGKVDMLAHQSYFCLLNEGDMKMSIDSQYIDLGDLYSNRLYDYNNDGLFDCAYYSYDQFDIVRVQDNYENYTWLYSAEYKPIVIRDFTNDGLVDLVHKRQISTTTGWTYIYELYENMGDFSFNLKDTLTSYFVSKNESCKYVVLGDLDNDGSLDLGYENTKLTECYIKWGNGQETLLEGIKSFANANDFNHNFDVNNDGYIDIEVMGGWNNVDGILLILPNHQYQFIDDFSTYWINGDYQPFILPNNCLRADNTYLQSHNSKPAAPTHLNAAQSEKGVMITWEHSHDAETPAIRMRYNISVKHKGKSGEGAYLISPCNSTKNGVHVPNTLPLIEGNRFFIPTASIPEGEYEVQVQGVDLHYLESDFSEVYDLIVRKNIAINAPAATGVGIETKVTIASNTATNIDWDGGKAIDTIGSQYIVIWDSIGMKTITAGEHAHTIYVKPLPIATFVLPNEAMQLATIHGKAQNAREGQWEISTNGGKTYVHFNQSDVVEMLSVDTANIVLRFNKMGQYLIRHTIYGEFGNGVHEQTIQITSNHIAPEISTVTNIGGHYQITWQQSKDIPSEVIGYRLYKESSYADVYDLVAELGKDTFMCIDITSNPNVQSSRYALSYITTYGESTKSTPHQGLHVMINRGVGTTWNLAWMKYEGRDIATYRIWRGTTPDNLSVIGEISGNMTSYSDLMTGDSINYYAVEVIFVDNTPSSLPDRRLAPRSSGISAMSNIISTASVNEVAFVEHIDVQGEDIVAGTSNTSQLYAYVQPYYASYKAVNWIITDGEDFARITASGLLSVNGYTNGDVVVRAYALDGSNVYGETTINVRGFDDTFTITYIVDGEVIKTEKLSYGSAIVAPESDKEGHHIVWYNLPEIMPTHDITVEGSYVINSYKITYIVDDEVYATDSLLYGATIELLPQPTKEGYTFSGWNDAPSTMPAHDVVVNGAFTINSYDVIYMVDGAEYKRVSVVYGEPITLEAEPTKEGHTFSGWSDVPETMPAHNVVVEGSFTINKYLLTYIVENNVFATDSITFGAPIELIAGPEKEGYTFAWEQAPVTMPAHDVVVNGVFTINSYDIIYMVDGAEYKRVSVVYGEPITLEAEPTKEGYTFSGWGDVPETMPAHNVVVEGSFSVNYYALTYTVDNEWYATDSIAYGDVIELREEPTREGYVFSGWSDVPETMPAHDVEVQGTFTLITSVNNVIGTEGKNAQKILYEDHIYILREGKVYSVMGQEL